MGFEWQRALSFFHGHSPMSTLSQCFLRAPVTQLAHIGHCDLGSTRPLTLGAQGGQGSDASTVSRSQGAVGTGGGGARRDLPSQRGRFPEEGTSELGLEAKEAFERGFGCSQQKDQCVQRPGALDSPLPTPRTERRAYVQMLGLEDGWSRQEVSVQKLTGHSVRSQTSPGDDREPA